MKKTISWATNNNDIDNNIKLSIAEEPVANIFSKLKSVASVTPVSVPDVTKELDSLKIEFALMNKKLDSILEILSLRSVAEDIPSASAFGI